MSHSNDTHVDELLSAARTGVGDELRSLTYFTEDDIDQLYLRSDLSQTADLVGFAENERNGFHAQSLYADSQLGAYVFTVRVFENGYLTRVIAHERARDDTAVVRSGVIPRLAERLVSRRRPAFGQSKWLCSSGTSSSASTGFVT